MGGVNFFFLQDNANGSIARPEVWEPYRRYALKGSVVFRTISERKLRLTFSKSIEIISKKSCKEGGNVLFFGFES